MCAVGLASRNRCKAGVAITASPSQFGPRTRIFCELTMKLGVNYSRPLAPILKLRDGAVHVGCHASFFDLIRFPAFMDPKPIGRIAPNRRLKGPVHFQHDSFRTAALAVLLGANLVADLDSPARETDAITNGCVQRSFVT